MQVINLTISGERWARQTGAVSARIQGLTLVHARKESISFNFSGFNILVWQLCKHVVEQGWEPLKLQMSWKSQLWSSSIAEKTWSRSFSKLSAAQCATCYILTEIGVTSLFIKLCMCFWNNLNKCPHECIYAFHVKSGFALHLHVWMRRKVCAGADGFVQP